MGGSYNVRIYGSDVGETWAELTDADNIVITDLALTPDATYVGFVAGVVAHFDFAGSVAVINDPNGGGVVSALWSQVAVAVGARPAAIPSSCETMDSMARSFSKSRLTVLLQP